MWRLAVLVLAACGRLGFDPTDPLDRTIAHLPDDLEWLGTGTLSPSEIDTSALTVDGATPASAMFVVVTQDGGPNIAVLQADTITIDAARVIGTRALVLVARERLSVLGRLDAGARGSEPGPGASTKTTGAAGVHTPAVCDAGGGGGGHATDGARGGGNSCLPTGVAGGAASNEALSMLVGGGGGGAAVSNACGNPPGGGGGGALGLVAGDSVYITGVVTVGGGGGSGGPECGDGDAGAGGGGGAGGRLTLDAPSILIDGGIMISHGGGGGAGGNGDIQNGPIGAGGRGADGTSLESASGGMAPAPNAGVGGIGGTGDVLPTTSASVQHNGGGGGGAAGRIVVWGELAGNAIISPAAIR